MAKKFDTLRKEMSPNARKAGDTAYRELIDQMSLLEVRKARELTQVKVAEELHIGQGDVSKLERRTDMYVSTLANYLHAIGADLEIRAVFPDGRVVQIRQFAEDQA